MMKRVPRLNMGLTGQVAGSMSTSMLVAHHMALMIGGHVDAMAGGGNGAIWLRKLWEAITFDPELRFKYGYSCWKYFEEKNPTMRFS
jgi:hypothetical protein